MTKRLIFVLALRVFFSSDITFAIKPAFNAKQKRHNTNELALFAPNTKLKCNKLQTNDLGVSKIASNSVLPSPVPSMDPSLKPSLVPRLQPSMLYPTMHLTVQPMM